MEEIESAIIIVPKEPYLDWMRQCGACAQSVRLAETELLCFVTEPRETYQSNEAYLVYLDSYKPVLFCQMLSQWEADEETWPSEDFTPQLFDQWFEIKFASDISQLEDLVGEEDDDSEDAIDDYPELDDDDLYGEGEDLHEAIMELLDEQLENDSPPQAKETFERLISDGFDEEEVRRLIALAIAKEIFEMAKSGKDFDMERYAANLGSLPNTPWLDSH